jgi:uncharacterized protein involved in tellurium resistance
MKNFIFSLILISVSAFSLAGAEPDLSVPQDAVITISGNRMTLGSFIDQVEKQTDYLFVYSKENVNVNALVPVKEGKKSVAQFLDEAFGNSNLNYVFENKYIVLTYKKPEYLSVSGTVIDAQTRNPLVFASVYIVKKALATSPTEKGIFHLSFPIHGIYSVRVSFLDTIPVLLA